jgi:hypothetical protein
MTRQAALYEEALRSLQAYVATGLAGFATKAYDRLLACGMTATSLGQLEDWDQDFAHELYLYLR